MKSKWLAKLIIPNKLKLLNRSSKVSKVSVHYKFAPIHYNLLSAIHCLSERFETWLKGKREKQNFWCCSSLYSQISATRKLLGKETCRYELRTLSTLTFYSEMPSKFWDLHKIPFRPTWMEGDLCKDIHCSGMRPQAHTTVLIVLDYMANFSTEAYIYNEG